ncbi:MAG: Uma2 family endonuclease [Gemmatimonadaceae bacterium]
MGQPRLPNRLLTVDEYLAFEEAALVKHEYVRGNSYEMAAVTGRHNHIAINLVRRLSTAAEAGPCQLFVSDMKLAAADDVIYYPDVMVACGAIDLSAVIIRDPCLVIEITSPSTARYDKTEKLDVYRRIPSLKGYLIVEQAWRRVERHWRDATGEWQRAIVEEGAVPIPCPETALTLDEIYQGLSPLSVKEMEAIGYTV